MPGNSFINFGKADVPKGESLQKGHHGDDGWIEISDWSWDIEAEHSVTKGTGAAVGKPTPGTLTITHYFDTSSTTIFDKIVGGKHFPTITIHMLKQTGESEKGPQLYYQVQVAQAFVSKVDSSFSEDGSFNQTVEFVFKEIAIGYKAQDNDGKLENSVKEFNWSITNMELAAPLLAGTKMK